MSVDRFIEVIRCNEKYRACTIADLYTTPRPDARSWCILSPRERYVSHEPYTQAHIGMFRDDTSKMLEGKQLILIDRNRCKLFTTFNALEDHYFSQLVSVLKSKNDMPYTLEPINSALPLIDLFKEIFPDPSEDPPSCIIL
jgi:hypothetical protein